MFVVSILVVVPLTVRFPFTNVFPNIFKFPEIPTPPATSNAPVLVSLLELVEESTSSPPINTFLDILELFF